MVTKTVAKTAAAPPIAFPDAPKREDMQNFEQLFDPAQPSAVRKHLEGLEALKPPGQRRSVFVYCDIHVRPIPTDDYTRVFVPDMTVAFDVDMETFRRDYGFAIEHQDKPPALVLEVASPSTGKRDYEVKRDGYESFRVPEYWRTDPSGGEWHDAPLAGDRLGPDGRYVPIPIRRIGDGILRGYSEALGLFICWEHGHLRFFDPEVGYLLTYDEEHDGRLFEAARADAAETARDAETVRADAAETARAEAETRARRLEARLQRLLRRDDDDAEDREDEG